MAHSLLVTALPCSPSHSHGPSTRRSSPPSIEPGNASLTGGSVPMMCYIRKETLVGRVPGDCGAIFLGFVQSRLQAEHHWAMAASSLAVFESQYLLLGVLCLVSP